MVHMDEKTPHLHLCFVPLTKDKRLSAKEILGNKKAMIQWQDDFYICMAERWPELERGTPAVETKRRHLTPQWYKKVTEMDAKLEKLETALNGINVLNAGKKREEAVALLTQLLPEVESFQAEIQRMQEAVPQSLTMQRCSAEENEALKDELTAERHKSAEQRAKLAALEERYKQMEKLLSKVSKELLRIPLFHPIPIRMMYLFQKRGQVSLPNGICPALWQAIDPRAETPLCQIAIGSSLGSARLSLDTDPSTGQNHSEVVAAVAALSQSRQDIALTSAAAPAVSF